MNLASPVIAFINDEEIQLVRRWSVQTRAGLLVVRRGATSDGASIPGVVVAMPGFSKFYGDTFPAAFAHDQLYAGELCHREIADLVFYDLLRANGVGWWRAGAMYRAVRLFGGMTYKAHTVETIKEARKFSSLTK